MARVQIIIQSGGVEVENVTADMSDQALELAVDALCTAKQHDPEVMSKYRFFTTQLRKYAEEHALAYAAVSAERDARAQAESDVNSLIASIVIT